MKKSFLLKIAYLLTATLILNIDINAQGVKRFDVTYSTGAAYTPLSSSATMVPFPVDWDEEVSPPISMPFAFNYQNVPVTAFFIESYGSIYLNNYDEELGVGSITGINMDYESKGRGTVWYETVGTTGNRILKIEFRNVGRWSDSTGNDTLNFQVWMYEANSIIEYRAGYNNVPASAFAQNMNDMMLDKDVVVAGLVSNLGDSISYSPDYISLHTTQYSNAAFSDTSITSTELSANQALILELLYLGYPVNGSIIRWVPHGTGVGLRKIDFDLATVYPNPSTDGFFNIMMKDAVAHNATLMVYNVKGDVVHRAKIQSQNTRIDLSKMAAGTYFGKIINGEKTGSFELVKK